MARQLNLYKTLKKWGLTVEYVPGWSKRGSDYFNPKGVIAHWTAGARGSETRPSLNICTYGRAGLPGPLCNVYLDRRGVCVIVAAGRANHAGPGDDAITTGDAADLVVLSEDLFALDSPTEARVLLTLSDGRSVVWGGADRGGFGRRGVVGLPDHGLRGMPELLPHGRLGALAAHQQFGAGHHRRGDDALHFRIDCRFE